MSLYRAMDINPTTKNIPNLKPNNCILSDKGDPLMASIMKYIKCPPSKTGTGSRFIIPKLILSSAKNLSMLKHHTQLTVQQLYQSLSDHLDASKKYPHKHLFNRTQNHNRNIPSLMNRFIQSFKRIIRKICTIFFGKLVP